MELMPTTEQLQALDTISQGWNADLKIDTQDFRVWLARTGLEDGEPFEHTVYVEANGAFDERSMSGWRELGHYDGDDPPRGLPGVTAHAFRGEC